MRRLAAAVLLLVGVALCTIHDPGAERRAVNAEHSADGVWVVWFPDGAAAERPGAVANANVVFQRKFPGRGGHLIAVASDTRPDFGDGAVVATNQDVHMDVVGWNLDRLDERALADLDAFEDDDLDEDIKTEDVAEDEE